MNRQPYSIPPKWWEPRLNPWFVRWSRGYRRRELRQKQKIVDIQIHGQAGLRQALADNRGVLITPNHSAHYDSNSLYVAGDILGTAMYFMTAWQVFGMSKPWERTMLQWMGCFSIDRESTDRKAYKQAVDVLQTAQEPLVIFPEGDIYHVTDHVTPFREGAAAIALTASRRTERPVVVVPCGIKFRYLDDPMPQLLKLMAKLEDRMHLRVGRGNLIERIHRFSEVLLATKEVDYLGTTQTGRVRDRVRRLAEAVLHPLEQRYQTVRSSSPTNSTASSSSDEPHTVAHVGSHVDATHGLSHNASSPTQTAMEIGVTANRDAERKIPERVKDVRQKVIAAMNVCDDALPVNQDRLQELASDMNDLFFVMQLYSYPGDYLLDNPSVERVAETLDKFEEDVLLQDYPGLRGRRRVDILFGEPIAVARDDGRKYSSAELTLLMQSRVQQLVDQLGH